MKETDREAVATAVQRVAGMLQRPDQLDKVEQYRRREARKKASVEARLKAAIQSQLDGVRTGLSQLHSALNDVTDIQRSLADVSRDWRQSINTVESLKDVKDAVVRHSQLAAAVENLKNIFSVPEIVRETQDLIEQGALLQAHRKLMDLECSRDGLMYEQYRMDSGNTRDMTLIHGYFGSTQGLSDELAKQLWMVLQRSLVTVRRDPTLLVSVVRIIEREEKIDRRILDRKKQTSFVPPGRPKNWKEKMFAILDRTVTTRIEGTQADTRESDKMWLVRHLEIIRKYVLDDLVVAKNLMVQCFPPHYEIFRNLLNMYHQALSSRMQELASEDLEASEIVSLLTWVLNTYASAEMMGNAELVPEVDVSTLKPLLSPDVVSELLDTYMSTLTSNIIAWLRKALETDKKDWLKETEPEADQDGYYQTTLPAIVFQMFEQNLQVAAQISEDLKTKVLVLCLQQMNSFLSRYKDETQSYKEEHLRDRQHPHCYVQYMIAIINNCQTFKESIVSLKRKYLKNDMEAGVSLSQPSMDGILDTIAKEGCGSLLEEVFLDLEQHLNELMTRKWLLGSNAVDTICVTVEDYFNDFAKIKKPYKKRMTAEAQRRVVLEYLRAVMQKRISFRSAEERKEGAERMVREAAQLRHLFRKLASGFGEDADGYCDTIVAIAEVIKLTDPSLLYLEVSTLVSKYPDIRDDHIGALLAMRGDTSRDMKQTIIETLEQGPTQANPNYVPIFKEITVPSLNVAKLLK
ncbi:exocyst complex component 3 isoform X1 [Hyaena hyaena]|uniref:exocyst complex component 3 isoform X1 n=1 Tax=Hyaena hyaena TaxID=95912 RepID=UPI001923C740|nr:exocyst complex component 3 isoform X1 [Hyaena hyaena]XP_039093948.1 exocyst complex component 3 isoform X1 [Hyaena hyaena]XP_039093949.1 exocyst complex component 3 isoform X1 [Hyaena hyaena]